jgi:hypothetical protein
MERAGEGEEEGEEEGEGRERRERPVGVSKNLARKGEGEVVDGACHVAWVLASPRRGQGMTPELVTCIRQALVAHPRQRHVIKAFALLARHARSGKVLGGEGGVEAVVRALKLHLPRDVSSRGQVQKGHVEVEVVMDALRGLWDLTIGEAGYRRKAGECGAVEAILNALQTYPKDPDVWQQGVGALWALSSEDAENKREMAERLVVHDVIVRGLRTFVRPEEGGLWEALLGLVTNLAAEDSEVRRGMGDEGVCALVLQTFETQPQDLSARVQALMYGLNALSTLCLENAENARRFGEQGCAVVGHVLRDKELMGCHSDPAVGRLACKWLHEQTCLAFARLLSVPEHRPLLIGGDTCGIMVRLLRLENRDEYEPFIEAVLEALVAIAGRGGEGEEEGRMVRLRVILRDQGVKAVLEELGLKERRGPGEEELPTKRRRLAAGGYRAWA